MIISKIAEKSFLEDKQKKTVDYIKYIFAKKEQLQCDINKLQLQINEFDNRIKDIDNLSITEAFEKYSTDINLSIRYQ
jgi:hypothetical protein